MNANWLDAHSFDLNQHQNFTNIKADTLSNKQAKNIQKHFKICDHPNSRAAMLQANASFTHLNPKLG